MKRRFLLITIVLLCLLAAVLTGCGKKKENAYFVNFASQGQFAKAEQTLLVDSPDTSIYSYDVENDLFVTIQPVVNEYSSSGYSYLYGIASPTDGVLVKPTYNSVISIRGDYAIVTKPAVVDNGNGTASYAPTIGVIKFRGENKGDLTDFMTVYNSGFNQFFFAGDYVACPGTKTYPFSTATFTTFYDYKTAGQMLEVFKIRCGYNYTISIYDDYLVAENKDHAFFYNVNEIQTDGYLTYDERGTYIAYPEDTDSQYTDKIQMNIYYIGNGWFTRTARLKSTQKFDGYNIEYEETDLANGSTTVYYANIRCDMYNAKNKTTTDREWLIVDNVANSYYVNYYAQLSSYLNNLATFDESTGIYDYVLPYMDVSAMIKKGYSIVYYYYFPYADSGSKQSEVTFCIMDENANIITIKDMLMPSVFVDGVGTETSDPMYEQYFGSVHYFTKNLEKREQIALQERKNTYSTHIYNGIGVVAGKIDYSSKEIKYGIVSTDGKIIVPFEYDELSPFYGDYAVGSKKANGKKRYRISTDGTAVEITDAVNVRQGVYVYEQYGKLGLKNYAGDILLNAEYEKLDVYDVFLTGGKFQSGYVIAVKSKVNYIFTIS